MRTRTLSALASLRARVLPLPLLALPALTPLGCHGGAAESEGRSSLDGSDAAALAFVTVDTATGERTLHALTGDSVRALSTAPGGKDPGSLPLEPATYDHGSISEPLWLSPDGAWVVWSTGRELEAVSVAGSHAPHPVPGWLEAWSPDGTSLLAAAGGGLELVALGSGARTVLAATVDPMIALDGGVESIRGSTSPNGAWIAYLTGAQEGYGDLRVVRADGTDDRRIATSAHPCGRVWSPDGARIAYLERTTAGDGARVVTARLDGTDPVVVHPDEQGPVYCSWSPSEPVVAISSNSGAWVTSSDGTGANRIATFATSVAPGIDGLAPPPPVVSWSKDGSFVSVSSNTAELPFVTARSDGTELESDYGASPSLLGSVAWAPVGGAFLLQRMLGDAATGESRPFEDSFVEWSADGRRFLSHELHPGGDTVLAEVGADGSDRRVVTEMPGLVEDCSDGVCVPRRLRFSARYLPVHGSVVTVQGDRLIEHGLGGAADGERLLWEPAGGETLLGVRAR